MTNRDWERFGQEIQRTVQNAVESGDFTRLNQTITNTVNQTVDTVAWNLKNFGDRMEQKRGNEYQSQPSPQILFDKKAGRKYGSLMLAILGYCFGGLSALALIVLLAVFFFSVRTDGLMQLLIGLAGVGVCGVCGFGTMALVGTAKLGRHNRFKEYVRTLGGREYCNLSELEQRVKKSHKFVIKDLEKMIKDGWFCQGHLDNQKTCLILSNQMYQQYLQIETQKQNYENEQRLNAEHKQKVMQAETDAQAAKRQKLSPEVRSIIEQGDQFVKKIRACNDAIPGEEISEKIYKMELVVDRIFDRVEERPESVDDIRKLMEYYLPTTIKLLEAYQQMDAQPIGGQNIQTAKAEIEATLDTLNIAFEKILDDLFMDEAWDVSTDISVLNTMLAQEGLKDDGLKK